MNVKLLYYNNKEVEFKDVVYYYYDVTFGRINMIFKNNQDIWKATDDIIRITIGE